MNFFLNMIFRDLPLGLNLRNITIKHCNTRAALISAKNKSLTKKKLVKAGISAPKTYSEITNISSMLALANLPNEFVIKPNLGMAGRGILVLKKENNFFITPSGKKLTMADIKHQVHEILDGFYSGSAEKDIAIIEERLYPSSKIIFKDSAGLPDIRIICYFGKPVLSMMRYSNIISDGRANLDAGAWGIGIDLASGRINHIHAKKEKNTITLADIGIPEDFIMPKWEELKQTAIKASQISGLALCGVDLVLDSNDQVRVLEINGQPGVEIQNINEKSMLESIKSRHCTHAHMFSPGKLK